MNPLELLFLCLINTPTYYQRIGWWRVSGWTQNGHWSSQHQWRHPDPGQQQWR